MYHVHAHVHFKSISEEVYAMYKFSFYVPKTQTHANTAIAKYPSSSDM